MLLGSLIVTGGLISMAWAKEIAGALLFWTDHLTPNQTKGLTLFIATSSIFVTDFAINAVQTCCRAIIVDLLPPEEQELGNGWAGRMIASGHLLGYFLGTMDLVFWTGGLMGDTQLKALCVLSSFGLLIAVTITSWAVEERVLVRPPDIKTQSVKSIAVGVFTQLLFTARNLPPKIATIFKVQLFAWYGWFCFLFYASTWVGEVYMKYDSVENDNSGSDDKVGLIARKGSAALLGFSCVSLGFSVVLPELLKFTNNSSSAYRGLSSSPPAWVRKLFPGLLCANISLEDLWFVSLVVYAIAVFSSGFVASYSQAVVVVAICGFSWAITTWAPFALLAEEIWRLAEEIPQQDNTLLDSNESPKEDSGVYLGLHNVAITVPQLVATFVSFLVYSFIDSFQGPDYKEGEDGGRAIAYTLQIGGLTALVAAYHCRRLKKN